MNRDALRATAHHGCVQPVRGSYGAIHMASRRRQRSAIRPLRVAFALMLVGGGIAGYLLLSGADSPTPSLRILAPGPNATIPGGKTLVTVEVQSIQLGEAVGSSNGYHLHYYLDAIVPTTAGQKAITAKGTYASTIKTSYEWTIANVGLHVLAVQLVTNDDLPLRPPVVAAVTVQVTKAPSSSTPTPSRSSTPTPSTGNYK